jgi:hypothetical protein
MSPLRLKTCWLLLPVLGLLLSCAPVGAADPVAAPGPQPFGLGIVPPEHLATLVLGAAFDDHLRGYGVPAALLTGTLPDLDVWRIEPTAQELRFREVAATTTAVLAGASSLGDTSLGRAINVLRILDAGDKLDIWTLRDTTRIEKIPAILLDRVVDSRGLPALDSDNPELDAYFAMAIAAARTPESVLEEGALRHVTYTHLFTEPKKYRGEVIQLTGKLKRIRVFDAPVMLKQAGIKDLYEGWIFFEALGPNPFCVVFSELPKGVEVAEQMDVPVKFAGYFLKKWRYTPAAQPVQQQNVKRDAPLLIGRTVVPTSLKPVERVDVDVSWVTALLPVFVGGIVSVAIVGFLLILWFRRGDAAIKKRLSAVGTREFAMPSPDESGTTPSEFAGESLGLGTRNLPGTEPGPAERN